MSSYQEIESRLRSVEDLLEFVSQAIRIGHPSPILGAPSRVVSMKQLYQESKAAGLTIDTTPEPVNG